MFYRIIFVLSVFAVTSSFGQNVSAKCVKTTWPYLSDEYGTPMHIDKYNENGQKLAHYDINTKGDTVAFIEQEYLDGRLVEQRFKHKKRILHYDSTGFQYLTIEYTKVGSLIDSTYNKHYNGIENDEHGNQISDGLGNFYRYFYDENNFDTLVIVTDKDGNKTECWRTEYHNIGKPILTQVYRNDSLHLYQEFEYNSQGKEIKREDKSADGSILYSCYSRYDGDFTYTHGIHTRAYWDMTFEVLPCE
jgi:hypothetical protein